LKLEYNFSDQHLKLIRAFRDLPVDSFSPIPYENSGGMGNLTGDYIRMSVLSEDGTFIRSFYSNLSGNEEPFIEVEYADDWTTDSDPQLRIYKDANDNLYVKPNEALELGNINEGNYQLQFDFLHNPFYVLGDAEADQKYYFYITEISPSRKEVRLVTRDGNNARVPIVDLNTGDLGEWDTQINNVLLDHGFNYVLVLSNARNIPITNYKIDIVSDPVNPSLILKLYFPLPTDVIRLADVTIEREIFTTQVEDIWYKTEAYVDPVYGYGLGYVGGILGIDDVE